MPESSGADTGVGVGFGSPRESASPDAPHAASEPQDLPSDPTIAVPVPSIGGPVSKLRISVRDVNAEEPEHVHLREIRLRETPATTAGNPKDSRT